MLQIFIPFLIFIQLFLFPTVTCVEIISSSPSMVVVREGEKLDLFCESSTPYQWCYWAHNSTEYPTTSHKGGGGGEGGDSVGVPVEEVQHQVWPPRVQGRGGEGGSMEMPPGRHGQSGGGEDKVRQTVTISAWWA